VQRPRFPLYGASCQEFGEFSVQENHAVPGGLDERTGGLVFYRPAAQSQHDFFLVNELKDSLPLALPELRLTKVTKDFGYRTLARRFNYLVQVDELPAEFSGQDGAHSGFAGAHEASQN
jgi:hypothetical protein